MKTKTIMSAPYYKYCSMILLKYNHVTQFEKILAHLYNNEYMNPIYTRLITMKYNLDR